jgi:hypothetical protein
MPGSKDFAVGAVGVVQPGMPGAIGTGTVLSGSPISRKPLYLVTLEDTAKTTKVLTRFIAIDKPDDKNGFIGVKGFFTESSEDEIIGSAVEMVAATKKETLVEMMFPWHRIHSIRSLVFNANKTQTLVK